ncbi:MAG: alpha/beta fold hydrolase, partial [Polyangiaceae bacterium]
SRPAALFAQSMGGVIATQVALQKPDLVKSLVLSVTSGGIDVAALGGVDWRARFRRQNPNLPDWFLEARDDLTLRLRSPCPRCCCGATPTPSAQSPSGNTCSSCCRARSSS